MNKHTRSLVNEQISFQIQLHNKAVDHMIFAASETEWKFWESKRSEYLHSIRCMIHICNTVDLRRVYRLEFECGFIHSHCSLIVENVEV